MTVVARQTVTGLVITALAFSACGGSQQTPPQLSPEQVVISTIENFNSGTPEGQERACVNLPPAIAPASPADNDGTGRCIIEDAVAKYLRRASTQVSDTRVLARCATVQTADGTWTLCREGDRWQIQSLPSH